MDNDDKAYTECTPEAFRQALNYLHEEAIAMGWIFPAHFIAVAAEAMRAYDPSEESAKSCVIIPFAKKDEQDDDDGDGNRGKEHGRW